jgi:hypothetical protein
MTKNLLVTKELGFSCEEMDKALKIPKNYYIKEIKEDTSNVYGEDVYWIVTIESCCE